MDLIISRISGLSFLTPVTTYLISMMRNMWRKQVKRLLKDINTVRTTSPMKPMMRTKTMTRIMRTTSRTRMRQTIPDPSRMMKMTMKRRTKLTRNMSL